jgi:hypothetical protein
MFDLRPLGSDACQWDSNASCLYWHLKCRAMAGEPLSEDERRFVGFAEESPDRDGWKNAATSLEVIYRSDHDRDELEPADRDLLVSLMQIDNAELPAAHALEFLG